ncbi:pyridoxal kinase PdxY [Nocardioides mangrovicus]|uniref:pyridoxal kinase n=1 Tax=Nocardioides mangrovicus TaxID=2478913 RepID=A0A3L8NYU8_9ACTN|nr:pyridoxal kinase PdxY [Nocardioides mangrovicus]RLV48350.1 pyridoxal kinase PdxY [Nocardioides mangrovicus]
MPILSIQSSVAYGHVGNSAAVFPLQRLGFEVWPVITVHFSNHTGYGAWRGPELAAADVREVVRGVEERGAFPHVEAVLSGYQGGEDIGEVVLDTVAAVKAATPDALYVCDPVMGDVGAGLYVHERIPVLMRERVVPAADVVTPNHFELGVLTHSKPRTMPEILDAVAAVRATGPRVVLVTSLVRPDLATDTIETLAVGPDGGWLVSTPRLPLHRDGAGDVTAALFTAHVLRGADLRTALERTVASVYDLMQVTLDRDSPELEVVAAQERFVEPVSRFTAEPV